MPRSLLGAALAAVGASLCCAAPLLLVSLGIGGAWVATLTRFAPLRPVFLVAALGLLGAAWYRLYRAAPDCAPDAACADADTRMRQRLLFWAVAVPVMALLAFPWYAPWFA